VNGDTVVIVPELAGGVGDYTRLLLEQWPHRPGLRIVVPKAEERSTSSLLTYPVAETARSAADLCARLPAARGCVLVQYSAYGFDQWGYPRWLINGLLDWKARAGGRLVTMFHEIWGRWPIWNKNALVQHLHRRDVGRLLRASDRVFTSTDSQAQYLAALAPRSPIEVLPVGSNIRPVQAVPAPRQRGTAVVFGLQPSRVRTLGSMKDELKPLAAVGRIRRIVTVGASHGPPGDSEEEARLREIGLADGYDRRGPLPENEISALLSNCEFAISAQDELSITKSGTFMAFAAHGANILSCYADATGPEPLSLVTSARELMSGVTEAELVSRGARLRQWHDRTSAWPLIAGRVGQALGT
jgi:hypothetical protein